MTANGITIERVRRATPELIHDLAEVLLDAIDSNAGVSFMPGLSLDDAEAWWRTTVLSASSRTVILAARDEAGTVIGTVQAQPSWAPNQPHRGDVAKLIVHRRARGRGVARALMDQLERHARAERFTLLLLDTTKGGAAERLYASLGWVRVGEVPDFALNPDGTLCTTVFFYRRL